MDIDAVARRYCLQNALQYNGTADPKSTMGKVMGENPELRARAGEVMPALMKAAAAVNAMSEEEQRAALEAEAPELLEIKKREKITGLKPLPNVDGKPVLRFAPNPNGPLSLGHGRGVAIMSEYAKMHDADIILRFDDTDPQVKPPLYDPQNGVDGYAWIEADFAWLAANPATRSVRASDRIETYYEHARELINRDGAYVCNCDAEEWRNKKNAKESCEHRDLPSEDNLEAFEAMVDGTTKQGEAVLRVKTDIEHKDPALRDWTAFRIVAADAIHPREAAGEIPHYTCWPLLDFESAVEDHLQGVTHIIRGKDLMDSTRKQAFLYEHMGWDYPETLYWGRVSIHEFGKFSTSVMRTGIEDGTYSGWDDPRLPTIRSLKRRGYNAEAVRKFWVGLGLTEKDVAVSLENMDAEDAKAQDDAAPRFFFVPNPAAIEVDGIEGRIAKPLAYPSFPEKGHRTLTATPIVYAPGDELSESIRLKDLGNVDFEGEKGSFTGEEMDRARTIMQWLPTNHAAPMTVLKPEFLKDGQEGEVTLTEVTGFVEPEAIQVGKVVQFERFGFVHIEDEQTAVWLHS